MGNLKTIIYLRTSTEDQNPENQLKECLTLLDKEEYEVFEEKKSAFKDDEKREYFNKIIDYIKSKKCDKLIVWDLDRIYRNRLRLKAFFSFCKAYGCNIYSFRQNFLNEMHNIPSPFDEIVFDMMIQIFGWIAEEESIKKSQRVKLAVRKKEKGTFSYKGNKWGRKQLSTYKKNMINRLRDKNKSIRDISKELSVSIGAVHKYISKKVPQKDKNKTVH